MQMTGSDGILSVPAEHLNGLVALVVAPLVAWCAIGACRLLAANRTGWAVRLLRRFDAFSVSVKVALGASYIGAVVHIALVPSHWGEDRTTASLFVLDAVGFVVAFCWIAVGARYWQPIALAMLGGTSAAYVLYLVLGWETVDLVGLVTTTIELAGALTLLSPVPATAGAARRRERWVAVAALPVALVFLLGTGWVASATLEDSTEPSATAGDGVGAAQSMPDMPGMPAMTRPGSRGGSTGGTASANHRALSIPTTSPAGAIRWPVAMGAMGTGMQMAGSSCTTAPSPAQQRAAASLVDRTVSAVARYRSLAVAKAAGYVPVTPTGLTVVHYINPQFYLRGNLVDPHAVPVLVYVNTPRGAVLSAAMYLMPIGARDAKPPQPGGCLTQWHVHTNLCFKDLAVVGITNGGACAPGSVNRTTPPMMHVWLTPVTGGALAVDPPIPSELAAASKVPPLSRPNGTA